MSQRRLPQAPAYWYDGSTPPLPARILSALYGLATALRRKAYRRGWLRIRHAGVPVIVVGNIVAGGSGKTPLTIALVERLRGEGWAPGVASRGHGRADAATPRWVDADSDAAQVGDEPLLIARRTGAKLRVDRDRVAAAQALVAAGCDIVVCDDGLQHYRLARDIYGIGFFSADRVALSLGFAADSMLRVRAAIRHLLSAAREQGHCYLQRAQITAQAEELLDLQLAVAMPEHLAAMEAEGQLRVRLLTESADSPAEPCYYAKSL